jgi:hypothetical protein
MQELPFVKNGKTLLSGIDPVRRAERTAEAIPVSCKTLYFCPSPLYGYGLTKFLDRLDAQSAVLCLEADPELYALEKENIHNHEKLRLTNIDDPARLCAFVRDTWGERAFRRIEIIRLTGGYQLFPALYDTLFKALQNEITTAWSNSLTMIKLGRLYIRNALRNLSLLPDFPSIANLSYGNAPVLVLGAGPSLDDILDSAEFSKLLRYPQNRPFKIICVDTCLGALKDRNIIPDLCVILESQHWNLRDFIGCRRQKVNIAVDLSALPASAHILSGEGYLFMTPWTQLAIFERLRKAELLPMTVPPLGSVGLSAVELARRLTQGEIICAGLDFSFTIDKYHARSTPGHREKLLGQSRFKSLFNAAAFDAALSKTKETVYTNPIMRNYRNLFEREFAPDPRLFDLASSGLPLGLKSLTIQDAILTLTKSGKQDELKPKQNTTENVRRFINEEIQRLTDLRNILTGESQDDRLETLINECDYLWAHFPDARPITNRVSFLNRLRMEIDPMLAKLETSGIQ